MNLAGDGDDDEGEEARAAESEEAARLRQQAREMKERLSSVLRQAKEETIDDSDTEDDDGKQAAGEAAAAADASRQKVTLKLRDKDNDVMKVTTFADEPFRTLLTRYCEKKGLVVAETCLNLDGDKLDLDTKPEDEDLEGGGAHPTLAPHPLASPRSA